MSENPAAEGASVAMSEPPITEDEVANIVIELVAAHLERPEELLRAELESAGEELPIDSLLIAEVLTLVEQRCGVRIPADADAARSMRSVRQFAHTVVEAARKEMT